MFCSGTEWTFSFNPMTINASNPRLIVFICTNYFTATVFFTQYSSVNTSHQTSIISLCKSPLAILKIWDISQHEVFPPWIFSAEIKMEMENLPLIIGMSVNNYNVEEVNIK